MDKFALITFEKPKYAEQLVAAVPDGGGSGITLFDAVDLFMDDDTYATRQSVFDGGEAKKFATDFVARFNSHASLLSTIKELMEALEKQEACWEHAIRLDVFKSIFQQAALDSKNAASLALSRAKSLMEQKP